MILFLESIDRGLLETNFSLSSNTSAPLSVMYPGVTFPLKNGFASPIPLPVAIKNSIPFSCASLMA